MFVSGPLKTVHDYVRNVRTLLLDRVQPHRYSTDSIVEALNLALLEGRRVRADLFVTRWGNEVPVFTGNSDEQVDIEPQFRLAFVYGIAWQVLQRDQEDVQDARATAFMNAFHAVLTGVNPTPIAGGTPAPGSAQR